MTKFWRTAFFFLFGMISAIGLAPPSMATSVQPLSSIEQACTEAARQYTSGLGYNKVNVAIRPLDEHLQLPNCDHPLETSIPPGTTSLGNMNIGVRCRSPEPWTIYVRAQVTGEVDIPVLARTLARNTVITAEDLVITGLPLDTQNGILYDPAQIVGMELTRQLNAGSPIKANYLRAPKVVKRGQLVVLVAGSGGLNVSMQGKANGDAAVGERVRVTNTSSGQQLEGIVNQDGSVSIP
ncbi:MAG: flagellar basal body P-ring formation chaperone FlgA [Porticoccaceae bacterium]